MQTLAPQTRPRKRKHSDDPVATSNYDLTPTPSLSPWGGYQIRMMLHFLYLISMLCLLRYDEALNILWEDIVSGVDEHGEHFIQLNLLFRKTHQIGSKSHAISDDVFRD